MKEQKEKLRFSELWSIIKKAFVLGITSRSKLSKVILCFGFIAAFFPSINALIVEKFTNAIHGLANDSYSVHSVVILFIILCSIQILTKIFESTQRYFSSIDTQKVRFNIKESVLRIKCIIKYKYIENYDDFSQKIAFVDTYAGERVANSIQNLVIILQNIINFIASIVVLRQVNIWIIIALIATTIPSVVISYFQNDADYSYKVKWMKEGTFLIHYFFDLCSYKSIYEVRYFGLFSHIKKKMGKYY